MQMASLYCPLFKKFDISIFFILHYTIFISRLE